MHEMNKYIKAFRAFKTADKTDSAFFITCFY